MQYYRLNASDIFSAAGVLATAAVALVFTSSARAELPPRAVGVPAPVLMPAEGAAQAGVVARDMAAVVADLGSAEYATRDRASSELLSRADVTLTSLTAMLKQPGLSTEAKSRLLAAAKEIFQRTPRGALGVQFGAGQVIGGRLTTGLTISRLIPGFPSSKSLRVGDEIIAVNGVTVLSTSTFNPDMTALRPHVIARDPGSVVRVTVQRPVGEVVPNGQIARDVQAETLTVDVELGSFDSLQRNNVQGGDFLSAGQLSLAWTIRQADVLGDVPVMGGDLTITQSPPRNSVSETLGPLIVMGGEANEGRPSERDPRFDLAQGRDGRQFGNFGFDGGRGFAGGANGRQGRWQVQVIDPDLGPRIVPLPIPELKLDPGNEEARAVLTDQMRKQTVRTQIAAMTSARDSQTALIRELKRAIDELAGEPEGELVVKELKAQIGAINQQVDQLEAELKRLRREAGAENKVP